MVCGCMWYICRQCGTPNLQGATDPIEFWIPSPWICPLRKAIAPNPQSSNHRIPWITVVCLALGMCTTRSLPGQPQCLPAGIVLKRLPARVKRWKNPCKLLDRDPRGSLSEFWLTDLRILKMGEMADWSKTHEHNVVKGSWKWTRLLFFWSEDGAIS